MGKRSIRFDDIAANGELKKALLLSGGCPAIFPLSTVGSSQGIRGIYDTRGYKSLSAMRNLDASEILYKLEKILRLVEECEDYLFLADEYILSVDTVYFSEETDRARLLYIPCKRVGEASSESSQQLLHTEAPGRRTNIAMANIVNQMKALTGENGRTYLDTLLRLFLCENLCTERILAFVEKLRYEIYTCGIS